MEYEPLHIVPQSRLGVNDESAAVSSYKREIDERVEDHALDVRDLLYFYNTQLRFAQAVIMWNEYAIRVGEDHKIDVDLACSLGLSVDELKVLRREAKIIINPLERLIIET